MNTDQLDTARETFVVLLKNNGWNGGQISVDMGYIRDTWKQHPNETPRMICRYAYIALQNEVKSKQSRGIDPDRKATLLQLMHDNPQVMIDFAEYLKWWDGLTKAERDAYKSPRKEQFKDEWMEQQPPTQKQLDLIAAKGYEGELPDNCWGASKLIDRLLGRRH